MTPRPGVVVRRIGVSWEPVWGRFAAKHDLSVSVLARLIRPDRWRPVLRVWLESGARPDRGLNRDHAANHGSAETKCPPALAPDFPV